MRHILSFICITAVTAFVFSNSVLANPLQCVSTFKNLGKRNSNKPAKKLIKPNTLPNLSEAKIKDFFNSLVSPKKSIYYQEGQLADFFMVKALFSDHTSLPRYFISIAKPHTRLIGAIKNQRMAATYSLETAKKKYKEIFALILNQEKLIIIEHHGLERVLLPPGMALRESCKELSFEEKEQVLIEAISILEGYLKTPEPSSINYFFSLRLLVNLLADPKINDLFREYIPFDEFFDFVDRETSLLHRNTQEWPLLDSRDVVNALTDAYEFRVEPDSKNRKMLRRRFEEFAKNVPLNSPRRSQFRFALWSLQDFILERPLEKMRQVGIRFAFNLTPATASKMKRIAEKIDRVNPNILVLNEVEAESVKEFTRNYLPQYTVIPLPTGSGDPVFSSALLYKKNLPILVEIENIKLDRDRFFTHGHFGFWIYPKRGIDKKATEDPLAILYAGHMKAVRSSRGTDLSEAIEQNRLELAMARKQWLKASKDNPNTPVLIMADLNIEMQNATNRNRVYGSQFYSVRDLAPSTPRYTQIGFGAGGERLVTELDVIAGNRAAQRHKLSYAPNKDTVLISYPRDSNGSLYLPWSVHERELTQESDHYLIYATFSKSLLDPTQEIN